jgi:hypothetical protein
MDRRLLFPAVAITAWAQQTHPGSAKAEKALRARAQEFFQLEADKKYRQAEAFVAEESRDDYYNGNKYNIKNFSIQKVELLSNKSAKVTIMAKVTLMMPQAGPMDFDAPATSNWKIEKGRWVLYIDPATKFQTPFGTLKPGQASGNPGPLNMAGKAPPVAALQESVTIDRKSLALRPGAPPETVTISNGLPGGVDLEVQSAPVSGLSWELEKKHLEAGEKTNLRFQAKGEGERQGVVHLLVSPTAAQLDITVSIK